MRSSCFAPLVALARTFIIASFCISLAAAATKPSKPAAAEAVEVGPVVALSPFEVTAQSMEFNAWRKVSSPHFTLYTDVKAKDAALLVRQMEMMHQAAQFFLKRKSLKLAPTIVVLPTGRSDWRKIGSRGAVDWQVATSLVGSTRQLLLAQYDWQSDGLASVWALLGLNEVFAMNLNGPLWFRRGLSSFFSTIAFKGDSLVMGKQGMDAFWVHKHGWMDWDKFFGITTRSPEFTKDSYRLHQYEGQCAVFVHYVLTHPEPAWTPRMLSWAAYLEAGNTPTEQGFKDIFQHDWKGWESQLDQMLKGGEYRTGNIRFPPAALQFEVANTAVAAREMRELFVLSQILNQNTKESTEALDALLARGLKTEALRELLADACERRGRSEAHLQELRTIIGAGSVNPTVFVEAAKLVMKQRVPDLKVDARLGEEVEEIRLWCNRALEIEPLHAEGNETLAWAEALAPTVEKRNLETIAAICRRLDGNAKTDQALAALAVARWRSGGLKQAKSLATRIESSVLSRTEAKNVAKDLLTRLNAPTPVPVEVTSPPQAQGAVDGSQG